MSKVLFQFAACGSQTLVCQVVADHVHSNLCCQLGEWRYGLLTYIDCIIFVSKRFYFEFFWSAKPTNGPKWPPQTKRPDRWLNFPHASLRLFPSCSKVLNAVDVVLGKLAIHLWEEE